MEFSPEMLTVYVLMWPVIVAGVLFGIVRAFSQEAREAKRQGKDMV
jgi:hypothetical protein